MCIGGPHPLIMSVFKVRASLPHLLFPLFLLPFLLSLTVSSSEIKTPIKIFPALPPTALSLIIKFTGVKWTVSKFSTPEKMKRNSGEKGEKFAAAL